jgi:hypothetical protein
MGIYHNKQFLSVLTLFSLLLFILPACHQNQEESLYSIEVFQNTDGGWGYDILKEEKKMIHQPHIPAVSGIQYFASEEEAQKVAGCMIEKLENNIMPPTVSLKELEELNITFK